MIPKEALEVLDTVVGQRLRETRDAIAALPMGRLAPLTPGSREPNARLPTGEEGRVLGPPFYVESDRIIEIGGRWVAFEFGGKTRPVPVEDVEPL